MSTVRQRYQPIALADILLDQDRFDSAADIEADASSFHPSRRIHLVMPDTRYLSAHPSTCSGVTPSTLAYPNHQDMTPFSSVSSFNFPATADATLLTPVSNAGSPPLPGHSQTKTAMRNGYPQSSSASQQPTPPNTSRGVTYGFPPYDIASSNSSSPMTVQPHSAEYTMGGTPYMGQSPNHHGHPSPKDDGPPPINLYHGHYSVSGNEPDVQTSFPDYSNSYQVDPQYITRGPGEAMTQMHPRIITTTPVQAPILAQPDPGHYRMHIPSRPGDIQDILMGHPGQVAYQQRPTPAPKRGRGVKKYPSQQKRAAARPLAQQASRATEVTNQDNEGAEEDETETVTLSDKCEEDLRFIFDQRNNLIKSGMKGKGMWEEICRRYEDQYGSHLDKPALQMRHARCIAKYAIWPEKETERLKEAFVHVEQKFHKMVLEHMREIGGARCYNWTEALIEAKLVEIGYEERDINEQTNTRKRRRMARRRRAAEVRHSNQVNENWANGLGLQPMQTTPQQQNDDMEEYMPEYTPEQREDYIESVLSRVKPEQLTSSPELDPMDVAYDNREEDSRDRAHAAAAAHQQSTRVAKQAVEQLMLTGARM